MKRRRDLREALRHRLEQIEDNSSLFYAGRESAYQAVAIQLRALLLDGRRGHLARVFSDPTLHELAASKAPPELIEAMSDPRRQGWGVLTRGSMRLSTDPTQTRLLLDFTDELMPVDRWVDQWILRPDVRIRDLIIEAAGDEVAHTSHTIGEHIARSSDVMVLSGRQSRQMYRYTLVALADYLLDRARNLLHEEEAL